MDDRLIKTVYTGARGYYNWFSNVAAEGWIMNLISNSGITKFSSGSDPLTGSSSLRVIGRWQSGQSKNVTGKLPPVGVSGNGPNISRCARHRWSLCRSGFPCGVRTLPQETGIVPAIPGCVDSREAIVRLLCNRANGTTNHRLIMIPNILLPS